MTGHLSRWVLAAALCLALLCLAAAFRGQFEPKPSLSIRAVPRTALPGTAPPTAGLSPNTATRQELMGLPGIGPATADAILEARGVSPFYFIEDLKNVKGIGDRRLETLRPLLSLP